MAYALDELLSRQPNAINSAERDGAKVRSEESVTQLHATRSRRFLTMKKKNT